MPAFLHLATQSVHIVADDEGYGAPDWEALPSPPNGPCEWNGTDWFINLAPRKASMIAAINAHAEAVRGIYLTAGSGQAMTYVRKEDEARRYEPEADPADFPFLSAEAVSTGATLADTAALVLGQATAWVTLGAAIEGHRRGLVVAIDAATDIETLEEIDIESGWPG